VDPGLWGYELKLGYDKTLINATKAEIPTDHFFVPETSPGIFIIDPGTLHPEEGFVSFALTCMAPEPGKTGSGVIATVTFEIIQAPPPGAPVSCTLDLYDVVLVDPDATAIPTTEYVEEDGYYEFFPPTVRELYLKVQPETSTAAELGDEVDVDVTISEVDGALKLVGAEFKLRYNTTLLEVVHVTEGDFMKSYGSTLFEVNITNNYVLVNITLQIESPPFPEGSETLATIKFNATYIPETLTTSDLTLYDVTLVDVDRNVIPYHHLESGIYKVPVALKPEDINGDGTVNIEDIAAWALAFGSYLGHPRWDQRCDINGDGTVNVIDGVKICQKFGKT